MGRLEQGTEKSAGRYGVIPRVLCFLRISEAQLRKDILPIEIAGTTGHYVDLVGPAADGRPPQRILGVVLPRAGYRLVAGHGREHDAAQPDEFGGILGSRLPYLGHPPENSLRDRTPMSAWSVKKPSIPARMKASCSSNALP